MVGFHNLPTDQGKEILKEIKKSFARVAFIGTGPKRATEVCTRINKEYKIIAMTARRELNRAPQITRKPGLEWLWRMILDPKRHKGLPFLIGFFW